MNALYDSRFGCCAELMDAHEGVWHHTSSQDGDIPQEVLPMAITIGLFRSSVRPQVHATIHVDCVAVDDVQEDSVFTDVEALEEVLEAEILQLFSVYYGRGVASCSCELTPVQ